jgi:hypothetical protein
MILTPAKCGKCGEPARYIVESVLCHVRIFPEYDDVPEQGFEYEGDSDVFWDTSEPISKDGDRNPGPNEAPVLVGCGNDHEWRAKVSEEAEATG